MSRQRRRRDPFAEAVGGCLAVITMWLLISALVTWLTP